MSGYLEENPCLRFVSANFGGCTPVHIRRLRHRCTQKMRSADMAVLARPVRFCCTSVEKLKRAVGARFSLRSGFVAHAKKRRWKRGVASLFGRPGTAQLAAPSQWSCRHRTPDSAELSPPPSEFLHSNDKHHPIESGSHSVPVRISCRRRNLN